jgi:hypothetical protein
MINPQKGIDLMNNTSIINRILFAVTLFQNLQLGSFLGEVTWQSRVLLLDYSW